MATDDERREVAERLRSFVTDDSAYADVDVGHVLHSIGLYYKDIDRIYFSGFDVARLADLIEPESERTCRNLNPPSCRDFECSECGESSEFTPGFMPNYCPHCGARVEETSDDADR